MKNTKNKNNQKDAINPLSAINDLKTTLEKIGVKMMLGDSEKDIKFVDSTPFDFDAEFSRAKTPADVRNMSMAILAAYPSSLAFHAEKEHLLYALTLFIADKLPIEFRSSNTIIDYLQNIINSNDFQNSETGSAIKNFAKEKPYPYISDIYQEFAKEGVATQKAIAAACKLMLAQHNKYVMKKKLMIAIAKPALKKYYEDERKRQDIKPKTKQKELKKKTKGRSRKNQDNTEEDAAYIAFCAKGVVFAFAVNVFLLLGLLLSSSLTPFNICFLVVLFLFFLWILVEFIKAKFKRKK